MLVNIDEYLKNLVNEKQEIENRNDEEHIRALVAEYEQKVRADAATRKASELAEKATQIAVLEQIIAVEKEKEEERKAQEPSFRNENGDLVQGEISGMGFTENGGEYDGTNGTDGTTVVDENLLDAEIADLNNL